MASPIKVLRVVLFLCESVLNHVSLVGWWAATFTGLSEGQVREACAKEVLRRARQAQTCGHGSPPGAPWEVETRPPSAPGWNSDWMPGTSFFFFAAFL